MRIQRNRKEKEKHIPDYHNGRMMYRILCNDVTIERIVSFIYERRIIIRCCLVNLIFGHLPDEIILTILTYLNKSSIIAFGQTSRRYRAIA